MRGVPILLLPLLFACASGGGRLEGPSPTRLPAVEVPLSSRGDRRIVLRQTARDELVILVNEGHAGRRSPEGQRRITFGRAEQGYKVLSDAEFDELLRGLDDLGFQRLSSPVGPAEEHLITGTIANSDVRGVVLVEEVGQARALVGQLPRGDPLLLDRLKAYSQAKTWIAMWFARESVSEFPPF
jgi:hypothetical protein